MAFQAPLISIPKKTTSDVDWTNPIRSLIAHSYGEDPKIYAEECAVLQRCRQDAVRGAGSDQTARDLLYKYFGQLELLELRFAEIKVSFAWNDAFTEKPTTQSSLAFEKASIIHLLSSVLSSLASTSSRADPEGLKRAYSNTRAAAGMLTYINENFLHAPSTDLSREVVHFCVGIMSAQSTEIFIEKLVEEKKSPALISRSANTAAGLYGGLVEEMKDFQGKGVFDRNWLYIIQIKAKLFASLAQYYRSLADGTGGKHGHSLVRLRIADVSAQDAQRQAVGFNYSFVPTSTPSIPSDSATSLNEITKAHAALVKEAKDQASRDNDLIYHDVLPSEASLPAIEKLPAAQPITIQEIYKNPDVSKLIGPDIFIRLVPLAVHESASVYSEEKAKLVRAEVERVELAEGEVRAGLDHLGMPQVVSQWKGMIEDDGDGGAEGGGDVSGDVRRLAEDVQREGGIDGRLRVLERERERCERELRELSGMLDTESRECERMRAQYSPHFTQSPSGPQTSHYRTNISSNLGSLQAASSSDSSVVQIWQEIQPEIAILAAGPARLEQIAREVAAGRQTQVRPNVDKGLSLLDLQDDDAPSGASEKGMDSGEKGTIRRAVEEAREKLDRLGRVRRERDEVLKDLKEKIQNDDVSSLLLMNRRNQSVEPQLFATELEKFRPYQSRIASAVSTSESILSELEMLVRQVSSGKGMKERSRSMKDKGKRLKEWENRLRDAGQKFEEVRAGLAGGQGFYDGLGKVILELRREVEGYVRGRDSERERMKGEIEVRNRISGGVGSAGSHAPPPLPSSPHSAAGNRGIESALSGLSLGGAPAPLRQSSGAYQASPTSAYPAPPAQSRTPSFPPPPPSKPMSGSGNTYDFSSLSGPPSHPPAPAPAHPPSTSASNPYPPPPPRPSHAPSQPSYPAPPTTQHTSTYSNYPPPSSQSSYPSYAPPPTSSSPAVGAPSQSQHYPQPPPRQGSSSSYYPAPPPAAPAHTPQHGHYQPPPAHQGYTSPPPPSAPQQQQYQQYQPPPSSSGYPTYAPPAQSQGYGGQYQPPPHQQHGQYPARPSQPQQPQQAYGYSAPPQQQSGGYYGSYQR